MGGILSTCRFLRKAAICLGVFLTCSLPVPALFSPAYAFDYYEDSSTVVSPSDQRIATPFAHDDHNQQLSLLTHYVRDQAPTWLPGAPSIIRNPSRWLQNRLGLNGGDDEPSTSPSLLSSLIATPAPEEANAMWFSPDYHHKGFLPINDAMIMGVNLRHRLFDERLQFDVHPFVGQNWHSTDGYWGTEVDVSLRDSQQHSWGKIAFRYNNGDDYLMDQNRGFDMHAEINFDQHLSLNAGVNGSDNSDLGNYVLMRWKLTGF